MNSNQPAKDFRHLLDITNTIDDFIIAMTKLNYKISTDGLSRIKLVRQGEEQITIDAKPYGVQSNDKEILDIIRGYGFIMQSKHIRVGDRWARAIEVIRV